MSQSAQTLQNVLGGAKTRGVLGEVVLERLLQDALPRSAYETQYRFDSTGAIVDAIVRSGDRILSVDSKFPLEAYRRLFDTGESARKEFSLAVRKHADAIAEKYILPDEHTFDYALMFVPSEGVYYELLMTEDSKYGQIDEYCRSKRVFTCLAEYFLCVPQRRRHQPARPEDRGKHATSLAGMSGLKKQFEAFAEVYDRLGTHLRHAQQSYEDADSFASVARAIPSNRWRKALFPKHPRKCLAPPPKNNPDGLSFSFQPASRLAVITERDFSGDSYCSAAAADSSRVPKSPAIVVARIACVSRHTFCVSSG